jgi:tetratricopeptide (TPR) repeat protein
LADLIRSYGKSESRSYEMKTFMRILAVSLLCCLPTVGFAEDLGLCKEFAYSSEADQSIRACTAIIQAKKETTANLAKAYNYRGNAYESKIANIDYDYQKHEYRMKADYKQAFADYNESIRLDPTNVWFVIRLAQLYELTRDFDRAIAVFTQVIQLRPDLGYEYRARSYSRKKDYKRSIADFNEAIRLRPKDMDLVKSRAGIYADLKDFDGAISAYDEAIKRDPTHAHSFQERGRVYYLKGDYDRAIADYDEAIRLPGMIQTGLVFYDRAEAYSKKGDLSRAIADYDRAIKIDPGFSAAIIARGNAQKLLKQ